MSRKSATIATAMLLFLIFYAMAVFSNLALFEWVGRIFVVLMLVFAFITVMGLVANELFPKKKDD